MMSLLHYSQAQKHMFSVFCREQKESLARFPPWISRGRGRRRGLAPAPAQPQASPSPAQPSPGQLDGQHTVNIQSTYSQHNSFSLPF